MASFGLWTNTYSLHTAPLNSLFNCFYFGSIMMLWNRKYQEFDLVVSSVTTKVKGVAQTLGDMVWDVVDYSGPSHVRSWILMVLGPLGFSA